MKRILWLIVFCVVVGALIASVRGQSPPSLSAMAVNGVPVQSSTPAPPTLSELDRLKIINASQQVELWQLKVQQAVGEYQKAQAEFAKQIAAVTPDGWVLNDKLEFVKKEGK